MNTASVDAMKTNADMVTHALIAHFAVPAIIGIILIGLAALAWEIMKSIFRKPKGKTKSRRHG